MFEYDTSMGAPALRDLGYTSVYVFAAPEYYFVGGATTHFLDDDAATAVTTALAGKLCLLPDNFVVIPGSLGRRRLLRGVEAYQYYIEHQAKTAELREEMVDNRLSDSELSAQDGIWGEEPKMVAGKGDQQAYVYSNGATVFIGRGASETYLKRYESEVQGAATAPSARTGTATSTSPPGATSNRMSPSARPASTPTPPTTP